MADEALAKQTYMICQACHGANGEGVANVGPPLAGNQWINGPAENLIKIQLRGLQGPITPKEGVIWKEAPMMMPNAFLSDDQIASVLTMIRSSWGNDASAITPAEVLALRSEVGQPMLKEDELTPLAAEKKMEPEAPIEIVDPVIPNGEPPAPKNITGLSGNMIVGLAVFCAIIVLSLLKSIASREA